MRVHDNPDVVMTICTAGHVDHGKTRLVNLLTGCQTDRLKEEQERGMTIELGFAPCVLRGNLCVGIVDVPGHEKFVKTMVAGVSGIDLAVLVIAADDGVMPQTVEHMQIMELLCVRHGMVALTKIDLVDEDTTRRRKQEIAQFLADTFMADAPICPVSSETGAGIFEFYDVLVSEIEKLAKTHQRGIFRMPIQRSFAQKGFGVIVTGIPVSGMVHVGDLVELVPGGHTARVRSIQRFLRDATEGGYGQCLALNVPDLSKTMPERGQVLCTPGYLHGGRCFHVQIKTVGNLDPPLRNGEQVKLHTGTTEAPGTLYLLESKTIGKNEEAFATIVVSIPVPASAHDRFIVRRPSPASTVAGGEILFASQEPQRPKKKILLDQLNEYVAAFDGADPANPDFRDRQVSHYLSATRPLGAAPDEIARGTMLPPDAVRESLARLEAALIVLGLDDHYMHSDRYRECLGRIKARIEQARQKAELSLGMAELQKGLDWPPALWRRIKADIETQRLASVKGDKLLIEGAVDSMGETDQRLMSGILRLYEKTGFESPRPDELPDRLGAAPTKTDRLLTHLCNEGCLIRLSKNVVIAASAMKKAQDIVVRSIQEKGPLDSADFKYHIGSTRKYALAILDYFDARKITVRIGNNRKLAINHEKNLLK